MDLVRLSIPNTKWVCDLDCWPPDGRTNGQWSCRHHRHGAVWPLSKQVMYVWTDGRTVGRSVELPVRWSIDWSHNYMSKLLPGHQIQSNKPNQNGLLNQKAQSLDSNGQTSTTTPTTLGQLNEWQWLWLWMLWRKDGQTDSHQTIGLKSACLLWGFPLLPGMGI